MVGGEAGVVVLSSQPRQHLLPLGLGQQHLQGARQVPLRGDVQQILVVGIVPDNFDLCICNLQKK